MQQPILAVVIFFMDQEITGESPDQTKTNKTQSHLHLSTYCMPPPLLIIYSDIIFSHENEHTFKI